MTQKNCPFDAQCKQQEQDNQVNLDTFIAYVCENKNKFHDKMSIKIHRIKICATQNGDIIAQK